MLRFRSNPTAGAIGLRQSVRASRRQRWRLWILLAALGAVIATMRQLNKPETSRRFEQLLGVGTAETKQPPNDQFVASARPSSKQPIDIARSATSEPKPTGSDTSLSPDAGLRIEAGSANSLDQVQDNTYFRPAESAAWFQLFGRLRQADPALLREKSLGELTYAQLLKQPQVYRGQIVTLCGTVRRQELEHPAENGLGIESYHRLVVQPRGGGHWPFMVYCLDLPAGFPQGDQLAAEIAVTGYFFKNWSYAWRDGLGLAPVLLARSVDWQPAVVPQPSTGVTRYEFMLAIVAASGVALLAVLWVVRSTRRPANSLSPAQSMIDLDPWVAEKVDEPLQGLAEAESCE